MMIRKSEQDRILDSGVLDPWYLSHICKSRRDNPVLKKSIFISSHVHRGCLGNLDVALENVGLANDSSEQ